MWDPRDGSELTEERLKSLGEAEECLGGLVEYITDAYKACGSTNMPPQTESRLKFDIWEQMEFVAAVVRDIHEQCDQTLPHDENFNFYTLQGRVRNLTEAYVQLYSGSNANGAAAGGVPGIDKKEEDRLKEAERCLDGLANPVDDAFKIAKGGSGYEPNAPQGEFDIWDEAKYTLAQLEQINQECDRNALTKGALKSASLADRVTLLIGATKAKESYFKEYENCLKLLQTEISKAHILVDGSGGLHGEPTSTEDPDIVSELKYAVNGLALVDEACNRYKVPTYKNAKWEDLSLDYRIAAIADSRKSVIIASTTGEANGTTINGAADPNTATKSVEEDLSDDIAGVLAILDIDAMERRRGVTNAARIAKIVKDLKAMKSDLSNLGVASPQWTETSMVDKVKYLTQAVREQGAGGDTGKALELSEYFSKIMQKLYDEIEDTKDERLKQGFMDILKKVLPDTADNNSSKPKTSAPAVGWDPDA